MKEYDKNMFFTEDENKALDHLTRTYNVDIPNKIAYGDGDPETVDSDPFYDEDRVIDQLKMEELDKPSLFELMKITKRIRLQRKLFIQKGAYEIFGDKEKLGFFLDKDEFIYGGK